MIRKKIRFSSAERKNFLPFKIIMVSSLKPEKKTPGKKIITLLSTWWWWWRKKSWIVLCAPQFLNFLLPFKIEKISKNGLIIFERQKWWKNQPNYKIIEFWWWYYFFSLSSRIIWKNNEHTDFFLIPKRFRWRKSKNNKILQTLNISYFFYYPKKNYFPKVYSIRFLNHHPHYHQHDRQKNREYWFLIFFSFNVIK